MKKFGLALAMMTIAMVFGLVLAGCNNGTTGPVFDKEFNVSTIEAISAALEEIGSTPGEYLIRVNTNLLDYPGTTLWNDGVNITVRGTGSNQITWGDTEVVDGHVFQVHAGKLTLENITLTRGTGTSKDWWPIIWQDGGIVEIKNGVTITNNNENNYYPAIQLGGKNATFIISGGIIKDSNRAIHTSSDEVSITMSGGTIKDCETGIYISGSGSSATISGGIIENCVNGVILDGNGASISMSNGTIRNTTYHGIFLPPSSVNSTLNISGGTIENCENGIGVEGKGGSITISGGIIRRTNYSSIGLWPDGANYTINITGGELSGDQKGITLEGNNGTVTISGGKIHGGEQFGVSVDSGSGHTVTKTGGTVTGGTAPYNVNNNATAVVTGF